MPEYLVCACLQFGLLLYLQFQQCGDCSDLVSSGGSDLEKKACFWWA